MQRNANGNTNSSPIPGAVPLFADPEPPIPAGIDLRCCDIAELLPDVENARLIIADPAWQQYDPGSGGSQGGGKGWSPNARPENHYPTLPLWKIAAHISDATKCAAPGARLAVWHCWPLLMEALGEVVDAAEEGDSEWSGILRPQGWRPVTGGAWHKDSAELGVGWHWLGHSEPVLVYALACGTPYRDTSATTRNGHSSDPGPHSMKPVDWQRAWIRRWTAPGDLVLDLYAGLGSVAQACLLEGRRYVGAELSPERHRKALGLLAGVRR